MVFHRRGALVAQFQSASLTSPEGGRCGGVGGCARTCTRRTLGRPARSWSKAPSMCVVVRRRGALRARRGGRAWGIPLWCGVIRSRHVLIGVIVIGDVGGGSVGGQPYP
jgi:hypothetical protein